MLTLNIDAFRKTFPEFNDTEKYSTSMITFWATFAEAQVRQCVWKTQWQVGVQLFTAHEITIAAQNVAAAAVGGVPGTSGGIAASKAVGSVSVSYDSANTAEKDAGYWNRTTYGQQFIRLARIFGAGAVQL